MKKDLIRDRYKATPVLLIWLQYHKFRISSEIRAFKDYIVDSRSYILSLQKDFDKIIEREEMKYPEQSAQIWEAYEDQHTQYNDFYPAAFNNSTLFLLYSFFEVTLKNLCLMLTESNTLKIKLDDLSGQNYIEKSKKYLTLIAGLDLNYLDSTWRKIGEYQSIRNCIVHNNANIWKQRDKKLSQQQPLYSIVVKNDHLKLNEEKGTFLISDDRYLLEFCDVMEIYFTSIISKLEVERKKLTKLK